jgi:predicted PurR-regulated permease PerM
MTGLTTRRFVERLVIALAVVGLALLLWQLRGLLILVFGAVLVSVILTVIAEPIARHLHLPRGVGLLLAVLVLLGLFGVALWLFGAQVAEQAGALQDRVPQAWQAIEARFNAWGLGESLEQWTDSVRHGGGVASNLGGLAMSVGSAIADTLLVIVGGIYLAAQPALYRTGIIKLVPPKARGIAAQAMDDSDRALRLWLRGQLVSMVIVGVLTGIGLWLIGVPSALALGLFAFILEFVPFVGPIVSAIPALVLALAMGPETALWVAALYVGIQQIEGNIVQPVVQERAVELPPALLIFAIVACGLCLGLVGIVFAAPLTVVIYVMVKRLYVRGALHTETPMPGEQRR